MKWIFPVEIYCYTVLSKCVAIKFSNTNILQEDGGKLTLHPYNCYEPIYYLI